GGEVLQVFVARVLAEIQDFRHSAKPDQLGDASLSPNDGEFHNAPKGGGPGTRRKVWPINHELISD
ncbi:MAG TPA: hypothetical protein VH681_01930, partial [Nitrospiraceae bacterium]